MSRLILKGNTIKNFGEFLPAPHIERIYVYDQKITVEISLMLTLTEDIDVKALLERLDNLTVNLYLTSGTSRPESLLDKDNHVYTFIALTEMFDDFTESDYAIIDFSEFESIGKYLYDTSGNKVLKLITTVDTTSAEDYSAGSFGMLILNAIAAGDESELALFAFSSMGGSFIDAVSMISSNRLLGDQNTSDVAYEVIFEDGDIAGLPEMIWMTTPARQPFDGIPLQAIGSAKYYKPDFITHKEITESFNELLEEVGDNVRAKLDTVLESVTDSISYILKIYGSEPDLLPRLDVLRNAWPDKSSTTHAGRLYKRFKGKLHKANLAVIRGVLLHKELVLNPKIIDAREPTLEDYIEGEIAELEDNEYLYEKWNIDLTGVISENAEEISEALGGGYIADYIKTSGFFYFDYEKLMHTASNIAAFFDTEKIDNLFGKGLLNSLLTVDKLMLSRYTSEDEDGAFEEGDLQVRYIGYLTGSVMSSSYFSYRSPYGPADSWAQELFLIDGTTEYSYLTLRNFAFPNAEVDTYRLMSFEFQDIWEDPYSYSDKLSLLESGIGPRDFVYRAMAHTTDNTHEIVKLLTSSYYSYYTGSLQDYYDIASEYCSYNDIDGKYNKFYIDAVMAAYVDNMEEAPWIRLPVVYTIHSDLLFGTFDGDTAKMIDASKKISDQINPYAGNLERLENFKEKFESLYDNYYAAGNIPTMMEAEYETSKWFDLTYTDLPIIYDETFEAQVTAAEISIQAVTEFGNWLGLFEIAQTTWQDLCNAVYSDLANNIDDIDDYGAGDCEDGSPLTWDLLAIYALQGRDYLEDYYDTVKSVREDFWNLYIGEFASAAGGLFTKGYLYEADVVGLVDWSMSTGIGESFYDVTTALSGMPVAEDKYIWEMGSDTDHDDVDMDAGGWSSWVSHASGDPTLKCEDSGENLIDNIEDVRDGIKSAYAEINILWSQAIILMKEALEAYEEAAAQFE